MIRVLGIKRLTMLLALLAIAGGMAFYNFQILIPGKEKADRDLRHLRSQIGAKQTEVDRLRLEFEELKSQQSSFDDLKKLGFFNDQDRVLAREQFEKIQQVSRLLSTQYEIQPAVVEDLPAEEGQEPELKGYAILNSPVNIKFEAVDDLDAYVFMYLLKHSFPGHTTINTLEISRRMDLTQPVLRQIGTGQPAILIAGELAVNWRTLVRRDRLGAVETTPADQQIIQPAQPQ